MNDISTEKRINYGGFRIDIAVLQRLSIFFCDLRTSKLLRDGLVIHFAD
jgi:hypothetical protein